MDAHKLVKMANEIAAFFEAEPERAVAIEGVAGHLKRFWDPRMRAEFLRHVDGPAPEGLDAFVVEAVRAHRAELAPKERSAKP